MKSILVIGATGNIGRQVISQLIDTDAHISALTRNPDKAQLPAKVEVVQGDLTTPETLDKCLAGIQTVFMVWTLPPANFTPVLERIARRAKRIVLLSAPIKTAHPFFQQPNPARDMYSQLEKQIETSGLEWIFLRPGMFAGNALHWWAQQIRTGNIVRWPYLNAPTAPIDERDLAAVAVRALCEEGHAEKEYVLTGPQSLTQYEQISIIGNVIGRSLQIEEMAADEAKQVWQNSPGGNMLLNAWAAALGQPAFVTTTVEEVTGKSARTFLDWATDHAKEFRT
ncbi:MAG TPA: NAD(P)H-binding protein [Bacteroidia bacterium]|nr:NAD(P)H-binding protein [Bacteroidia bacterium]